MSIYARTSATLARAVVSAEVTPPLRFPGARKRLVQHGIKALLPSAHAKFQDKNAASADNVDISSLPSSERAWYPPLLSKRKAAMLRKEAIRSGTYGSFDADKGTGWDSSWDVELAMANPHGLGRYSALRIPKKSAQRRSREERAQKIEAKMEGMDERMEQLQAEKHRNKPPVTFENTFKELMKVKK
jgi:hypothetical protein